MIESAIRAFQEGKPVLIYDGKEREGETDIAVPSQFVQSSTIRMMRKDGGGLICTTLRWKEASIIGLPFIEDLYRAHLGIHGRLTDNSDLRYDKNSSFSIGINHRSTFTGIPDDDRSKTITEFASLLENLPNQQDEAGETFSRDFRTPGHVMLLIARPGYFSDRRGHTELSTYLAERAGITPSVTIVEMLDDNGKSLTREKAIEYAEGHGFVFIDGQSIISDWKSPEVLSR